MSDRSFPPPLVPLVPLMTPERARDTGRMWKALADHLTETGVLAEARYAERQSRRWLTYSIALATKPPEAA